LGAAQAGNRPRGGFRLQPTKEERDLGRPSTGDGIGLPRSLHSDGAGSPFLGGGHAKMVVTLRRPRFPYRVVLPILVTLIGIVLTVFAWLSEQRESRLNRQRLFEAAARSNLESLAREVRSSIADVREIAKYWQLHGVGPRDAWEYQAAMFLSAHRGTVWMCWVGRDSSDVRIAASDAAHWPQPEDIRLARSAIEQPTRLDANAMGSNQGFYVAVPVRTPEDSLGIVVTAVRADSLVVATWAPLASIIAVDVRTPAGQSLDRVGNAAKNVPASMVLNETFQFGTGELWQLEFRPTDAYFLPDRSPGIFLLAGLLLSMALGALAFQFLRLREFSNALGRANRELDDRLRELSHADRRMREANAQLESNVQHRTAQLNEAVEEIAAFSHSTSHDLRSPIGVIMNFAHVLEEDFADRLGPEGVRHLHRIRAAGTTATRLLDRLVQFMWVGRKVPERNSLDMNELARSAWREATSGDASDGSAQLNLDALPGAVGDAELVHRVFVNLMSNALKYTRGKPARSVRVSGHRDDGWSTYAVSDNGVGFDPKDADSIFEPFRRLHEPTAFEGTGLGLAIAAKIVRRHGGTISADSDGVHGAKFEFTLPSAAGEKE
jgi:signal transduction histidine kinase